MKKCIAIFFIITIRFKDKNPGGHNAQPGFCFLANLFFPSICESYCMELPNTM